MRPSSPRRATPSPRGATSPCSGSLGSDTDPGGRVRAWPLPPPSQPARVATRRSAAAPTRMRAFSIPAACYLLLSVLLEDQIEHLADERRLLRAADLDLDTDAVEDALAPARALEEPGLQPHLRPRRHRGREPQAVDAVVDPHPGVLDGQHLGHEHRQHREREVPVRDRAAERALRGGFGIDVNPLVVSRRLGEEVDLALVDSVPRARAQVALLRPLELLERQPRRHTSTAWVCVTWATRRSSSSTRSVCTTMKLRPTWSGRAAPGTRP